MGGRRSLVNKKKLTELIPEYDGNISAIARAFKVDRRAIYNRIENDPELGELITQARESILDDVESALYREAKSGKNVAAMIFFMKTQGQKRGYIESNHVQFTGKGDGPLKILVEYGDPDQAGGD